MWQYQVRLFAGVVVSMLMAGCGGVSVAPTPGGSQPSPQPESTNTLVAADFPGADCGAKIMAADASTSSSATIAVTQACGATWSTQVVVGPSHTLLVEDGTYQTANSVLLHDGACVVGQNAVLVITRARDIITNADSSNSNLCVKTIALSGARVAAGRSRGIYFKNVHGFTISGVDIADLRTHGVFIDDGSDNGQILNNMCHGVAVGSCFLAGNSPGFAVVSNITISNNTISNVKADGIFVIGRKNGQSTNHITIENNVVNCARDVSIEIGDGVQNVTASGNQVAPCTPGTVGIMVRSAQHVLVENNSGSPTPSAGNMTGIYVWNNKGDSQPFQDVTINHNTFDGFAGTGSSGISWSSFSAASSGLFITNNTATGNTINFYPRTHNIKDLVRSGNSDGVTQP